MNKPNKANKHHCHLTIIFVFILYKELLNNNLTFNIGIEDFNNINKVLYMIRISLYNAPFLFIIFILKIVPDFHLFKLNYIKTLFQRRLIFFKNNINDIFKLIYNQNKIK